MKQPKTDKSDTGEKSSSQNDIAVDKVKNKEVHVVFPAHHKKHEKVHEGSTTALSTTGSAGGAGDNPSEGEKSSAGSSDSTQEAEIVYLEWPRRVVYMTMLLHGVGTLMPWNVIINAKDYFVNYKLSKNYTNAGTDADYYALNFLPDVGFASQFPSLIFTWCNIFVRYKATATRRIIWSLATEALLFVVTIILALVDTSGSPPAVFFWLTMITVAFMNMAGGIHQNSVYGIGAMLQCAEALIIGANISGTLVSLMNLVSMAVAPSKKWAAVIYFSTALIVLIACIVSYMALSKNVFYKIRRSLLTPSTSGTRIRKGPPYLLVVKQCWQQCLNVFLVFFVTLSVYPAVHSDVKRVDRDFFVSDMYYVEVMCFLNFNLFSMIGSSLTTWLKFPTKDYLWIPVVLRFLFIPFFLACNYQPHGVNKVFLPNWSFGDVSFLFGGLFLGLTNGYFSSLAMVYCPSTVKNSNHAPLASMFGAACLVSGVFIGINFSRLMPVFVGNVVA